MQVITCPNCICNSAMSQISFSKNNGLCSECNRFSINKQNANQKNQDYILRMENAFNTIKSRKYLYDALVMFSGGKDSSYLLYLLKSKYKLNVLAFSVIHPFVNQISLKNIKIVTDKLGVDSIQYKMDENIYKKLFRHIILQENNYGLGEFFGCGTCATLYHIISLKTAIMMHIPCIVDGSDPSAKQFGVFINGEALKKNVFNNQNFIIYRKIFEDSLGDEYKNSICDFDLERYKNYSFPIKISPFSFLNYDYKSNLKILEQESLLNKELFNSETTNCDLHHFFAYISFKVYGFHPFTRIISIGLRNHYPTYIDQFRKIPGEMLSRDEHINFLNEYKEALFMIATKPNYSDNDLEEIKKHSPTFLKLFGDLGATMFLKKMGIIHCYSTYFNIALDA